MFYKTQMSLVFYSSFYFNYLIVFKFLLADDNYFFGAYKKTRERIVSD